MEITTVGLGVGFVLAAASAVYVAMRLSRETTRRAVLERDLARACEELGVARAGQGEAERAVGSLRAEVAGLGARGAGAEAGLARAEAELSALRGELVRASARGGELQVEAATLGSRLRAAEAAGAAEVEGVRASARQEIEAAERVHAERVAAAQRAREEIEKRLAEFDEKTKSVFGALAAEALERSSGAFLKLAEQKLEAKSRSAEAEMDKRREAVDRLVAPLAESILKTHEKLGEIEKERAGTNAGLAEQVRAMLGANESLRAETVKLSRAMSKPDVRGLYGQIQLRRVAELAGMTAYCDFCEQVSVRDSDGALKRPDMTVKLPNDRVIAVDAKMNTLAYLEACEAKEDGARDACLERFAKHVADQAASLSDKKYWSEFEGSPEFVVMFIPGDQFLDAALARRPDLLDYAAEKNVILASPATLIGLLRAVAVGWRERKVAEQAAELFKLGSELHGRAAVALEHLAGLGSALRRATDKYNEFVGSMERRFMPTLRRFEEAGAKSARELPEPEIVTEDVRVPLAAPSGEDFLSGSRVGVRVRGGEVDGVAS